MTKLKDLDLRVDSIERSTVVTSDVLSRMTASVDDLVAEYKKKIDDDWTENVWSSIVLLIKGQPEDISEAILDRIQILLDTSFDEGRNYERDRRKPCVLDSIIKERKPEQIRDYLKV